MDEGVEAAVLAFALENPAAGQVRVSNELRKRNTLVSPTGVRSVRLRHGRQTSADTYAKVAFAKLYTTKTPIAAADLLNDRVLPFYQKHEVALLRILTDRGSETAAGSSSTTISSIWL